MKVGSAVGCGYLEFILQGLVGWSMPKSVASGVEWRVILRALRTVPYFLLTPGGGLLDWPMACCGVCIAVHDSTSIVKPC